LYQNTERQNIYTPFPLFLSLKQGEEIEERQRENKELLEPFGYFPFYFLRRTER